ncbi:MAG TPA: hypothetical protein VJQ83_08875 [Tepidiformaceae bacterium]|nr:hypothetical protein [Tepidiformaceae bacterium]
MVSAGRTAAWFGAFALVVTCATIAGCGGGGDLPSVTLSQGLATVVATGSPDAMAAKASRITGLQIVIPKPLPEGAYIKEIIIPGTNAPIHGNPHSATVIIQLRDGQYVIDELARDANVGLTEADLEVTSLESPGRKVYWNGTGFGYTVLGKGRSYYLSSGGVGSNATAKADLAKMIPSLPVE